MKAKPPSPPASSSITTALSGSVKPNATSSPREEPNGLEDSINGAPAKRPHSPTQEDLAKRHKEAEVRRVFSVLCRSYCVDVFLINRFKLKGILNEIYCNLLSCRVEFVIWNCFRCRWCPMMTLHLKSHIHHPLTPITMEKDPIV